MNPEVVFSETQRFKQWWLWMILIGLDGLILFGIYQQMILGKPFGDNPGSDGELIMIAGLMALITVAFYSVKLETEIKKDGIYVRFFPFHFSFRFYPWENISKSFVRQYNPILEYGGWGVRFGFAGKGKAFNVSGNKGLQLEFNDHKKLLIGTDKPEELENTLMGIRHLKQ